MKCLLIIALLVVASCTNSVTVEESSVVGAWENQALMYEFSNEGQYIKTFNEEKEQGTYKTEHMLIYFYSDNVLSNKMADLLCTYKIEKNILYLNRYVKGAGWIESELNKK